MRSIPLAMTWELLYRGRWNLIAATLAAIAFPALIFAALEREGALDPHSQPILALQYVLMQVSMMYIAMAAFGAPDKISRLYVTPASTPTLVAWRMLPAMAVTAIASIVITSVLNALFALDWPLWGPALLLPVAMAAIQAAVWLFEKSAWAAVAIAVAFGPIALWFKLRYGPLPGLPAHPWTEVTPSEVLTMLAAAIAAYGVAVVGVARNRRGEPPFSLGIFAWLEGKFERLLSTNVPLGSPARAQTWFEWQRKGWAMPAGVVFALLVFFILWSIGSRDAKALLEGLLAGGGMLTVLGSVGALVMGLCATNGQGAAIGSFLATRPMTDSDLAGVLLKTAAGSVLLAWTIWVAAVVAICWLLLATGLVPDPRLPAGMGLWYFPMTLIAMWTIVGIGISMGLAGRPTLFVKIVVGCLLVTIGWTLFAKFALSVAVARLWNSGLVAAIGVGLMIGVGCLFAVARRRSLVSGPVAGIAPLIWILLGATVFVQGTPAQISEIPFRLLALGLLGLSVMPLAAAPLALAWNRHR